VDARGKAARPPITMRRGIVDFIKENRERLVIRPTTSNGSAQLRGIEHDDGFVARAFARRSVRLMWCRSG